MSGARVVPWDDDAGRRATAEVVRAAERRIHA
jgi:hypothetical protein